MAIAVLSFLAIAFLVATAAIVAFLIVGPSVVFVVDLFEDIRSRSLLEIGWRESLLFLSSAKQPLSIREQQLDAAPYRVSMARQ